MLWFDFGALSSLRELDADEGFHNYFQARDVEKHSKIVERRLLAAVLDYLDGKGVDIFEFRQRATAILNSGVMHFGSGSVNVTGSAVGTGATVNLTAPDGKGQT